MINAAAVYVLWLRDMKRFIRARSRIIGSLAMPLFFLAFLTFGFNRMAVPGMAQGRGYMDFLVPGIIGMGILFSSMMAGLSVLWDREFGFLKEIMVAPVSRVSIVLGRIAGGTTIALIQAYMILIISLFVGFHVAGPASFFLAFVFIILISASFIGLGLIFASRMKDMQGFSLVMNFIIFPLFFLSGALYPLDNFPRWIRYATYVDPLTYGIDGLRASLIGFSSYPLVLDLAVLLGISAVLVFLGAWFFETSESV